MSAESPRRVNNVFVSVTGTGNTATTGYTSHITTGSGNNSGNTVNSNILRSIPAVVPPQPISDRSIFASVTGFINDVTLTNAVPQIDPNDQILWARFENCADISDSTFGGDWDLMEGGLAPPLLLILGYGTGIQVYAIPANGEAIEVLSWRHSSVKCLRILPTPVTSCVTNEPTDEYVIQDLYSHKRPLMAICSDSISAVQSATSGTSGGNSSFAITNAQMNSVSGTVYCSINFISLKDGDQVKSIKFKNPIIDILANRTSIAITFSERIAVFDARTLEDRLTVTTCYPSPGLNPNPVALGTRWIAYAERKLYPSKRSSGGCDCDGVSSYTATVLNAAKSIRKGILGFGEQMAAGLTGNSSFSSSTNIGKSGGSGIHSNSSNSNYGNSGGDDKQPGVITILDIKYSIKDTSPTTGTPVTVTGNDPMIAHFLAHSEPIVSIQFDYSGLLLLTADKRGHDFHVFRIQPHPTSSSLAGVHHLYVLHRGDTTAKVQDVTFSLDSRWVAISTLRGTTHIFPLTPYGGQIGVRTHGTPVVVNRLSRFHRSAGLSIEGRSNSPVSYTENLSTNSGNSGNNKLSNAYNNPRLSPFPHPTIISPLAQLRQPPNISLSNASSSSGGGSGVSDVSGNSGITSAGTSGGGSGNSSAGGRQRLTSLSEDSAMPLRVCSTFAHARSWLLEPPGVRQQPNRLQQRKAIDSLFIATGYGTLVQYDLEPKPISTVPKEKVCNDTAIELDVEAKAYWNLMRKDSLTEIQPPLPNENWLLKDRLFDGGYDMYDVYDAGNDDPNARWLSQVELVTHAGPHRRLWMGPQFTFKTYNACSGKSLSHIDSEAVEIGINSVTSTTNKPERSNPMNMPGGNNSGSTSNNRTTMPVIIEAGSYSSYEQSPRSSSSAQFTYDSLDADLTIGLGDSQLREDLADAMRESPSCIRETGVNAGIQAININIDTEELSSSSFSSTSRASFDQPSSSPTASIENFSSMPFYGDSSGSF